MPYVIVVKFFRPFFGGILVYPFHEVFHRFLLVLCVYLRHASKKCLCCQCGGPLRRIHEWAVDMGHPRILESFVGPSARHCVQVMPGIYPMIIFAQCINNLLT